MKRTLITAGGVAAAVGLTIFAIGFAQGGGTTVSAQETTTPAGTSTVAGTTTPAATRTAGPLTPVSTPTGGAAAGTSTAQLPDTGTGTGTESTGSWAVLGLLVAAMGAGAIGYGITRRTN